MSIRTLGKTVVTAAGTPVQVSAGLANTLVNLLCKSVQFQALPGNTGIIYIGKKGMVVSTGVLVMLAIPAPSDATKGPFTTQSIGDMTKDVSRVSLADLWMDAGNSGEGCYITVIDTQ